MFESMDCLERKVMVAAAHDTQAQQNCPYSDEDVFNYSVDRSEGLTNPVMDTHVRECQRCRKNLESFLKVERAFETAANLPLENPARSPEPIPQSIGGFQVRELLARGGMGEVYRAYDAALERELAVKVMREEYSGNSELAARFNAEAKTVAKLSHPNIVQIHAVGTEGHKLFIAMEFIDGAPLSDLIRKSPMAPNEAVHLFLQVLAGIGAAHQNEIVHRDIKPANIMIDRNGHAKILDFGLAKTLSMDAGQAAATAHGTVLGTLAYMAPEVATGKKASVASDIYALGVVLYQMLTARVPFNDAETPLQLIERIKHEPLTPPNKLNPALPDYLNKIIMKMCAKDPAKRYSGVQQIVDDLLSQHAPQAAMKHPALPLGAAIAEKSARKPARGKFIVALGALFVTIALFQGGNPYHGGHDIMENVYTLCAAVGGTLFVLQFLLSLLGLGDHHDVGGGHDHDAGHDGDHEHGFFRRLSARAFVAAVTFFGLCGLAAAENGLGAGLAIVMALAGGFAAMALVGAMMNTMSKLRDDGTAHIEQSVGRTGTVYLTIPGKRSGTGKVMLNVQNRTMEYLAVTAQDELPTGAKVIVVDLVSGDTVEVAPAPESPVAEAS